jgi:hypothetical protein
MGCAGPVKLSRCFSISRTFIFLFPVKNVLRFGKRICLETASDRSPGVGTLLPRLPSWAFLYTLKDSSCLSLSEIEPRHSALLSLTVCYLTGLSRARSQVASRSQIPKNKLYDFRDVLFPSRHVTDAFVFVVDLLTVSRRVPWRLAALRSRRQWSVRCTRKLLTRVGTPVEDSSARVAWEWNVPHRNETDGATQILLTTWLYSVFCGQRSCVTDLTAWREERVIFSPLSALTKETSCI